MKDMPDRQRSLVLGGLLIHEVLDYSAKDGKCVNAGNFVAMFQP